MKRLGLEEEVVDAGRLRAYGREFRERQIALPTFAELADPSLHPRRRAGPLEAVGADEAHPLNLFRVHWHNDAGRTGHRGASRSTSCSRPS